MYRFSVLTGLLLSALLVVSKESEVPPLICPSVSKPTQELGCQRLANRYPRSNIGVCCTYRDRCIRTCDHTKLSCEIEYALCMVGVCRSVSIQFPELSQTVCLKRWSSIDGGGFKAFNLTDAYDFSCEYMAEQRKLSGCPNYQGEVRPVYLDTFQDPDLEKFQIDWDIPL
ncbi:hypothetical protein K493DRAFT_296482 [Basidiobolus meristosporus CBS 931.73]|uniref:Uncharacterized protein n=1 Tax=Basidiobolus meristosporus CBS 931.73 TaxID=1314790 RepID=A0A1Y1Z599_9FUNG|nr:hypothetical protein K493DRAFT_296482 [Basidiobolus meristosporus CBS 931.73]|eukprot:ORY05433.1 hypothetical protein K493DRAFT_296482 [Basidiobolus meristosporus CBS 931.73]